jgi:argininosuccinate lyase
MTMTSEKRSAHGLWGGRFSGGPAPAMEALGRSLPVDARLWREDVRGSRAWVRALAAAEVLTPGEARELDTGLGEVAGMLEGWGPAEWAAAPDEDIHTLVERLLHEVAGALAGKLHTGRSRNDQVATDVRLWGMAAVARVEALVREVERALLAQAERHVETVMPGYTHLQRAQPISAAQWLLSHAWALERDRERLAQIQPRVAVLPLGSGAISGCPFPVDRVLLQETLGFRSVSTNSVDAVADRDWIAELLFALALTGVHLSRLAEDLVLYASAEFGLVRLSDGFSTGSSLMPQKRNPDAAELTRGKAGRLIGGVVSVLTLLKGLPSGYNRDLQEDKEALFDAVDTMELLLPALAGTVATLEVDVERCREAVEPAMLATEIADALVRRGVPFREAHSRVGRLVAEAERLGVGIDALPWSVLEESGAGLHAGELAELMDPARAMGARQAPGGTAPEAVRAQIARLRPRL